MLSSMYSYPSGNRIKKADDFSSVFVFRKVLHAKYFKIHYKPNDVGLPRLGLVVSKRVHKRANKRNYMKRLLRELFRHEKVLWDNYDMVVRVQKCFTQEHYHEITAEFARITKILAK